jgi:hypothetical protein
MDGEHLHPSVLPFLTLPDDERFAIIRKDVRITTEHMENVRIIVTNMLGIERGSMEAPCLIVTAESNNGKTTICNVVRGVEENWRHKVKYVSFAKDPKLKRKPSEQLYLALGLNPDKNGIDLDRVFEHCLANDIRAVFMDEFQDAIKGMSKPDQEVFLSMLKGLCGAPVYISFFAFGTSAAINALGQDAAYVRRFEKYQITPWALQDAEFLNFLDTWEELAPLANRSNLSSKEISSFIHKTTGGVVGNICDLLKGAACAGISYGLEKISIETLESSTRSKWLSKPRAPL